MNNTDNVMKYIVGVATAAALALSGWSLNTTATTKERVSVQEERTNNLKDQLEKIDAKVDKLLDRIPPRPEWRRVNREPSSP